MEENVSPSAHMKGDNNAAGDNDGDYYLESSWNSSDYVIIIRSEDDVFEEAINSKRRRIIDLEREVYNLREDNEEEVDESEDDRNVGHPQ